MKIISYPIFKDYIGHSLCLYAFKCYEIVGRMFRLVYLRMDNYFHFTLCNGCDYIRRPLEVIGMPSVWAMSEERPSNLLDVWLALHQSTKEVLQCVNSHAAHTLVGWESFVHIHNFFGGLACENVSWHFRTFPKRVQHSQNIWESRVNLVGRVTTCNKVLPHAGHTLTPRV